MRTVHVPAFSGHSLVTEMREAGASFRLEDGVAKVRWNTCVATPALVDELARLRADIIAILEAEREEATPVPLGEARALVETMRAAGFTIALEHGRVRLRGTGTPLDDTAQRLKANRDAIVRVLAHEQGSGGGA